MPDGDRAEYADGVEQQTIDTGGNPKINSGSREAQAHSGIDGSWHRHASLEWWDPEKLYDDEYARPICPVSECATGDPHECRTICKRINVDREIRDDFIDVDTPIGGAWFCGLHGWFRVFEYPAVASVGTTQQTLVADGGQPVDGTERTECWQCGYDRLIYEACPECGAYGGEA